MFTRTVTPVTAAGRSSLTQRNTTLTLRRLWATEAKRSVQRRTSSPGRDLATLTPRGMRTGAACRATAVLGR